MISSGNTNWDKIKAREGRILQGRIPEARVNVPFIGFRRKTFFFNFQAIIFYSRFFLHITKELNKVVNWKYFQNST